MRDQTPVRERKQDTGKSPLRATGEEGEGGESEPGGTWQAETQNEKGFAIQRVVLTVGALSDCPLVPSH